MKQVCIIRLSYTLGVSKTYFKEIIKYDSELLSKAIGGCSNFLWNLTKTRNVKSSKFICAIFQGGDDFMSSYISSLNSIEDNNMFGASIQSMLKVIAASLSLANVIK